MLALVASAGEEFPSDDECIEECITNADDVQLHIGLHAEDGVGKNDG